MVERLSEKFVPLLPFTLRSREAMSETREENDMVVKAYGLSLQSADLRMIAQNLLFGGFVYQWCCKEYNKTIHSNSTEGLEHHLPREEDGVARAGKL